ncbi:hypothetical protein EJB05_47808 [Eragrostis curvula]|uniref:Uncharacterized protein n=1 Tax=Eragrostis curvula TaxID=38414 RepID=A0A5J9T072_9POAL|nr:hypothetical protein EJB05_47808 [Eragrostis curvula]
MILQQQADIVKANLLFFLFGPGRQLKCGRVKRGILIADKSFLFCCSHCGLTMGAQYNCKNDEGEMAQQHAAAVAADDDGESPSSTPGQQDENKRWLQTLSEPELDLVISLKELVVAQATSAGHAYLADKFNLHTLRALGDVLLEHFKERLEQTSGGNTIMLHTLGLLSDPDEHVPTNGSSSQPVVPGPNQLHPMSNGVEKKRKQMQHGLGEEGALSSKKRKIDGVREE